MNSFLHHKFYTMHQTGHKTVVTIMYAGAMERRTKHDDILKLSRRKRPACTKLPFVPNYHKRIFLD